MTSSTTQIPFVVPVRCIWLAIFAGCALLSACNPLKNIDVSKQAVVQFHSQLDSERYNDIYAASDDKFHKATSEADFTRLLQVVHRKLGGVQRSALRNSGVAWNAGQGATVTLIYDTTFATGSGSEQFVWHVSGDRAILFSYHINSNDLILN